MHDRRGFGGTLAVLALFVGLSWSPATRADGKTSSSVAPTKACGAFDHEHAAWTALLGRHVQNGSVDYAGIKRVAQGELDAYLRTLAAVDRACHDTWSRQQKLAYWINAYNAYTVRLILDHYPLGSIRSIGLMPGAAFRETFIPSERLRGRTLALNDIEHEILRKELQEPRIHFAIVCASKSCPTLRPEAYRASELERQLDGAARAFVGDASKNRFDASTRTLWLSSIFTWFHEDFERSAGSIKAFVVRYSDKSIADAVTKEGVEVKFLDYDWSLNGT